MPDYIVGNTGNKVLSLKHSFEFIAAQTEGSLTLSVNGILRGINLKVPQVDGTPTVTITIADADKTIFSIASLAENTTHQLRYDTQGVTILPMAIPMAGQYTVTITFSGAPGVSTTLLELMFN